MRRTVAGWAAALVVAVALGWWAGRSTFEPPRPDAAPAPPQTYTVTSGTVGATATYTAVATWPMSTAGFGAGDGTVTSVAVAPGDQVDAGDVLYAVDLRPVVAAPGAVPSFRDLAPGTTGDDVRQLQDLLRAVGVRAARSTGTFDAATSTAVRRWQKLLGVEQTGTVRAGDVVFLPTLPARVVLGDDVTVGSRIGAGAAVVRTVAPAPEVEVRVGADQRAEVPTAGSAVRVQAGEQQWDAVVGDTTDGEDGELRLRLTAPDGGPVCGTACGAVPFTVGELRYTATAVLRPEVSGSVVPVSAVGSSAGGSAFVRTADGDRLPVEVLATDGSRAVVDGVAPGDVVALFAVQPPDGGTSAQATGAPTGSAP